MPPTHTSEPEAQSAPTLPLRILEYLLELLGKVVCAACHILASLANSIAMVITLGFPYLHYWIYRRQQRTEADSDVTYYQRMIETLETPWDIYPYVILPMISLPFPMVSSSGLPLCSLASFLAAMTLTVGVVSVATSIVYKLKFKALGARRIVDEWSRASQQSWYKIPNKSFWILLSLPTFIFFLSVVLFIATAVLSIWERPVDGAAQATVEMRGCSMKRLHIFKSILLTTLTTAVAHFGFVIAKLYSMAAGEATVTNAV